VSQLPAEAGGCHTINAMKRICIISLFILLAGCSPAQNATPTKQTGVLSLDMQPACQGLIDGLCVVSEPGELLGEGKTTVITEKPVAAFLDNSTALQIKIGQWTLVFDPGLNTPFSVGMTFPNATLYPQGGSNVSMTVENNGRKCDEVEGIFTDNILQSSQKGDQQVNPVTSFDIQFAMRCNKQPQVILGEVKLSQP
jgi:hypothetical protein